RLMLRGLQEKAQSLGYSVQHFWTGEPDMKPSRLSSILRARGIRGAVLAPPQRPESEIDMDFSSLAVVGLERSRSHDGINYVTRNHSGNMQLCRDRLVSAGYRRIGLAVDSLSKRVCDRDWETTYMISELRTVPETDRIPPLMLDGSS